MITSAAQGSPRASRRHPESVDDRVVRLAAEFIRVELDREAKSARFYELPSPWSKADDAEFKSLSAPATQYHERLAEIATAKVSTQAALIAQATVTLWHTRGPSGDECHAWNLAASVLRVMGQQMPDWLDT